MFVKVIRNTPTPYAKNATAKATPNTDAMEETAKAEALLESPEAPVEWGPLPLLVDELPLPLGRGEPELEEVGTGVAA